MLDVRARKSHRLRFWAVVAVLGAFVLLWYTTPSAQRWFCQGWTAPVFQWSGQCDQQWQRVTAVDAQAAVDGYLGLAGGTQPEQAWEALGPDAQAGRSREEFLAAWSDVAMAERVAPMRRTANRFNWFTFDYRVFRTPARGPDGQPDWDSPQGLVEEARLKVRLQYSEDGVVVADLGKSAPTETPPLQPLYAWGTFTGPTVARTAPSDDAPLSPDSSQGNWAGGRTRVVCELTTSTGRWYASHLGWFPAESVELSDVPGEGVLACSPHPSAPPTKQGRSRRT
jgi:hypothetical protein